MPDLCRYRPNYIHSTTNTVAANVTEPVTLQQIKDWLAITFTDDDTILALLGKQCRDGLEKYTKRSIVAQTWVMVADLYEETKLPYGPVTAITAVSLRNGTIYEANTNYGWDIDANVFCAASSGRYKITYSAGPMDMVSNASLQADLLRIIAYCYENKGDQPLSTLQGGNTRPAGLDQALELFASKYVDMTWL